MAKTLDITDVIVPDRLGTEIANKYISWENARRDKIHEWDEIRRYVFATDTTKTSNSNLPWKNTTTTPKLCQIRDNLIANYLQSLFPKKGWLVWEGARKKDEEKRKTIELYMDSVVRENQVKSELRKALYDYVDYGNSFGMAEWVDDRIIDPFGGEEKVGFVGSVPRRISPLDIVFDPTAPTFDDAPKIIRSLISIGELKKLLKSVTPVDNEEAIEATFNYLKEVREAVGHTGNKITEKDDYYRVDGFDSFQHYLSSRYVEVLTFYGDLYDAEADYLYENYVITIVDRHKVVGKHPSQSIFGKPPIRHAGWRIRQDNLWAAGPLDNLVGLQYRIDHLENMKADVWDFSAAPIVKVKGYVEDFDWSPMSRIFVGDDGDVEIIGPDTNILNTNLEIAQLEEKMEQMAGAPKEALGIRSPGEKTAFEVQRLETAAGRVFQAKILQWEDEYLEQILNDMLEQSRRKLDGTTVRVLDDEIKLISFKEITNEDLAAVGRIRPVAAKHFAEKATQIQNLTQGYQSGIGADPEVRQHISSKKLAQIFVELMDVDQYGLFDPYVRITEQVESQRMVNAAQEELAVEQGTPAGIAEDDFDPDMEDQLLEELDAEEEDVIEQ